MSSNSFVNDTVGHFSCRFHRSLEDIFSSSSILHLLNLLLIFKVISTCSEK